MIPLKAAPKTVTKALSPEATLYFKMRERFGHNRNFPFTDKSTAKEVADLLGNEKPWHLKKDQGGKHYAEFIEKQSAKKTMGKKLKESCYTPEDELKMKKFRQTPWPAELETDSVDFEKGADVFGGNLSNMAHEASQEQTQKRPGSDDHMTTKSPHELKSRHRLLKSVQQKKEAKEQEEHGKPYKTDPNADKQKMLTMTKESAGKGFTISKGQALSAGIPAIVGYIAGGKKDPETGKTTGKGISALRGAAAGLGAYHGAKHVPIAFSLTRNASRKGKGIFYSRASGMVHNTEKEMMSGHNPIKSHITVHPSARGAAGGAALGYLGAKTLGPKHESEKTAAAAEAAKGFLENVGRHAAIAKKGLQSGFKSSTWNPTKAMTPLRQWTGTKNAAHNIGALGKQYAPTLGGAFAAGRISKDNNSQPQYTGAGGGYGGPASKGGGGYGY